MTSAYDRAYLIVTRYANIYARTLRKDVFSATCGLYGLKLSIEEVFRQHHVPVNVDEAFQKLFIGTHGPQNTFEFGLVVLISIWFWRLVIQLQRATSPTSRFGSDHDKKLELVFVPPIDFDASDEMIAFLSRTNDPEVKHLLTNIDLQNEAKKRIREMIVDVMTHVNSQTQPKTVFLEICLCFLHVIDIFAKYAEINATNQARLPNPSATE